MNIESGERLIVALDLPTRDTIYRMYDLLFPAVKTFKLGLQAYAACGPSIVETIKDSGGDVFLDLKYHDIPATVHRACLAALELGVDMINVHASGGRTMMEAAARARELWVGRGGVRGGSSLFPAIIAVTLLTNIGKDEYREIFGPEAVEPNSFVGKLSLMAKDSGLQGVVASGREARLIREMTADDFLIVTPGVRPAGAEDGGHARRVTPVEAISNGADFIVVGRPITASPDPLEAAMSILEEIRG